MAIVKQAKNIIILTENKEIITTKGKLEEIANVKVIEATKENLILNCVKNIVSNGNKQ